VSKDRKPTEKDKRVRKLEKIAADKGRSKKERKAARAELDALKGVFVPTVAIGDDTAGPSSPSTVADIPATSPDASAPDAAGSPDSGWVPDDVARRPRGRQPSGSAPGAQDAEVARQWAHHHLTAKPVVERISDEIADPSGIATDLIVEDPEPDPYRLEAPGLVEEEPTRVDGDGSIVSGNIVQEVTKALFDHADDVVQKAQEAVEVETEQGREFAVGAPKAEADVLEKPADPVLENGNGQPMIHYRDPQTGKEKVKGYTRVTTYIDCLDDKTVLNAWKARVLLEGGAVELLQNDGTSPSLEAVARSVKRTDEALADIDRRTREEGELLELRRQEVQREHRDNLARIAEDLLELGGAHEKANKGTDLHRLTELVDTGQPLPPGRRRPTGATSTPTSGPWRPSTPRSSGRSAGWSSMTSRCRGRWTGRSSSSCPAWAAASASSPT
jgi:hypothetical protein